MDEHHGSLRSVACLVAGGGSLVRTRGGKGPTRQLDIAHAPPTLPGFRGGKAKASWSCSSSTQVKTMKVAQGQLVDKSLHTWMATSDKLNHDILNRESLGPLVEMAFGGNLMAIAGRGGQLQGRSSGTGPRRTTCLQEDVDNSGKHPLQHQQEDDIPYPA